MSPPISVRRVLLTSFLAAGLTASCSHQQKITASTVPTSSQFPSMRSGVPSFTWSATLRSTGRASSRSSDESKSK